MHAPAEWHTLARDIASSYSEPGNSEVQTRIFMRCMSVLSSDAVKDETHLFCREPLRAIAGHTLIMFSFPGTTSPKRRIVEDRMARSLSHCCRCVRGFYTSLSQLRARFVRARQISIQQVLQFLDIVNEWVYSRLEPLVVGASGAPGAGEDSVRMTLYECLSNVALLRSKPNFRAQVATLISPPTAADLLPSDHLLPSTVFYAVEGNTAEAAFASSHFRALKGSSVTLDSQVVDEICHQCHRLQNVKYFSADLSVRFWSMVRSIFEVSPPSEINKLFDTAELPAWSAHTQIRLSPFPRVFFNNLMSCLEQPFPVLLEVLRLFFARFGAKVWALVPEVHSNTVMDTVLRSGFFQKHLHSAASSPVQMAPLLDWIPTFVASLSGPQKQTAAIKFADFLVSRETAIASNTRVDSVQILLSCFENLAQKDASLSVALLKMQDARSAVNRHSEYFVGLARKGSTEASALVCACLKYDLALAGHNSTVIQQKKCPTMLDSNKAVWTSLAKVPLTSSAFASEILASFSDASAVIVFKDTKSVPISKEFEAAWKIHNRDTRLLCESVTAILEKLALMDPVDLRSVLSAESCSAGIWSCIFNPQMSQPALAVVSQVYDSEGRYENIFSLLNESLDVNIGAINRTLSGIAQISVFEPCPKGLRILMDIITALTDPLKGILNTQTNGHSESMSAIRDFWQSCWSFLVMIYKKTLEWASLYHLSDLIEFTRDTLDASHLLLDSFRVLMDYFADSPIKNTLFETFMATFIHMIVWLRLGDLSLLNSCVNLVFKGFDLAKELGAHVDKNFIITFAKYGAKAKKFNNKLSEQQRSMILAKASDFDAKLVQYVIDESAKERSSVSPPVSKDARSDSPEAAAYAYQTRNKGPKQTTLSRFGVVTNEAPVAPAPPQKAFKSNNLEAIRSELKNNRAPTKPVVNPAPPRPAGFNHKLPVVGRSLNSLKKKHDSDSSEEDEEADVDVSDLFLDSKKKPKIIEVDIHGRPVPKIAQAKKIDTRRQEEERMRLRLNVNLKPLYSTVLRWNYNTDSEFPTEDRDIYRPIKDSYASAKEYVSEIEPLLMLECWQGIQSSRVTGQELPFELLVGSRTTCDGFFDVYVSMKKADLAARKIGETDLLVLGYVADKNLGTPHEVARYLKSHESQTCLAKVREIKFANSDYSDVTVRVYPQGSMMGLLTPKSVVVGMKVMQMITVEREYSSLRGLPYYDLCDEILAGKPCKPRPISDDEARGMCGKLGVNMSQAKAIIGANREEGFSLIQGPPGTGKTKTILGIVGHFLSSVASNPNIIITPVPNGSGTSEDSKPVNKVLICAPSNAAVDELVVRLKDGVVNDSGEKTVPKIVRLGRPDAMNAAVRHLSLEELIESQLKARTASAVIDPNIRLEHNKCIAERDRLREALKNEGLGDKEITDLQAQLREINKKRSELGSRLDEQRESASIAHRTREIEKRQIQAKVLSEAQVICSTLSGSAHDFLASMSMKFDQVIIDEACQCVELSAIIPLRYGCKKCVMVGDPNQLPPTVLSQKAASYKYEESLFVRMQRNNSASIYLLDVQYRMHPAISRFPSAQFYNSKLSDGEGMSEKNTRPWHDQPPLTPYRFFDIVSRQQQNQQTKSFFNSAEARVALELVETLMKILPENEFRGRIGIISPYKEQIRTLRDTFQKKFGTLIFNEIDFNTVDGFQGQEKEIIIMSCVRASETGSVGFLSDVRRMNVALTRARTTLWILGNKTSLRRDKVWNKLISDAEARSVVSSVQPGFLNNLRIKPARESSNVAVDENGTSNKGADKPAVPDRPPSGAGRPSNSSVYPAKERPEKHKDKREVSGKTGERDRSKRKHEGSDHQKRKHKKTPYVHKPEQGSGRPIANPNGRPDQNALNGRPDQNAPSYYRESGNPNPNRYSSESRSTGGPPRATNSGVYRPDDRSNNTRKPPSSSIFIKNRKPNRPPRPGPPRESST